MRMGDRQSGASKKHFRGGNKIGSRQKADKDSRVAARLAGLGTSFKGTKENGSSVVIRRNGQAACEGQNAHCEHEDWYEESLDNLDNLEGTTEATPPADGLDGLAEVNMLSSPVHESNSHSPRMTAAKMAFLENGPSHMRGNPFAGANQISPLEDEDSGENMAAVPSTSYNAGVTFSSPDVVSSSKSATKSSPSEQVQGQRARGHGQCVGESQPALLDECKHDASTSSTGTTSSTGSTSSAASVLYSVRPKTLTGAGALDHVGMVGTSEEDTSLKSPGSVSVTSAVICSSMTSADLPPLPKKQTLGEILQQIENKAKSLLDMDDFTTGDAHADLQYLAHQSRYSSDVHVRRRLISKLVECKIVDLFLKVFHSVHSVEYIECGAPTDGNVCSDLSGQEVGQGDLDSNIGAVSNGLPPKSSPLLSSSSSSLCPPDSRSLDQLPATNALKNLRSAIMFMWNATDKSSTLCEECIRGGVIQTLVEDLTDPRLAATELKDQNRLYLVKAYLGILNNVVRFYNDAREIFREAGAVKILQQFLKSSLLLIKTKTIMLLSYIMNESENDVINASDRNIAFVVKMLQAALESDNHYSKKYGFWAVEITAGLNRLGIFEWNKERLVEKGALGLYLKLLHSACSDDEQLVATQGLWTISFSVDVRQSVRQQAGALHELQSLSESSPRDDVRRAAKCVLWLLEGRKPLATPKSPRLVPTSGHVMLSYHWSTKHVAMRLRDRLRAAGYRVWLDTDNMTTSGCALDTMTEAVESAVVILLCMTQKYKDSPSCRNEVEYASLLKKDLLPVRVQPRYNPDGWLGTLVGAKLFDISTQENLDHAFANLVRELGPRGRSRSSVDHGETGSKASTSLASSQSSLVTTVAQVHTSAPPSVAGSCRETRWTCQDVGRWLRENSLDCLMDKFKPVSGELLLELKKMKQTAPEAFYKMLRHDLPLDFVTTLRFTQALDKLAES